MAEAVPPPLAIHLWWSDALKNHAAGRIAAIGANVEEARTAARCAFRAYIHEEDRYVRHSDGSFVDEDDAVDLQKRLDLFERDIAKEAELVDAVCIRGSD